MKKKVPYAVANFEKLREENYFFIDKTAFIEEMEKYTVPVFLRPRRFGKSLWCSLLECYYDINRGEKFNSLFGSCSGICRSCKIESIESDRIWRGYLWEPFLADDARDELRAGRAVVDHPGDGAARQVAVHRVALLHGAAGQHRRVRGHHHLGAAELLVAAQREGRAHQLRDRGARPGRE